MPHFICRWPGGDVLLASVESRQELDAILQERCEPGVCKVARYHGPLVLELKPDIPGVPYAGSESFKLEPACTAFQAAWHTRLSSGDAELMAADGSRQRVHRLVLQCRLPVLAGQPLPPCTDKVRLQAVPDGSCLQSLVEFLYLDDVQQQAITHQLYLAALACHLHRLVLRCEAHYAQQLEVQLHAWPGLLQPQREAALDSFIGWACFAEQQDRLQLLQLCVHALAAHFSAAQSRASWSLLSASTATQVRLIALSTAPPIIHRQVLPSGQAIVPALPPPTTDSQAAGQTPGQTSAAVVSVDAEAFAAAGGRLTSWEWQQLQKYQEAVADCKHVAEASPVLLEQGQLKDHSLATRHPSVAFAVKPAVLTPHRRLMDSVCRFAFPATHGLLATGWTLQQHKDHAPPATNPPAADLQLALTSSERHQQDPVTAHNTAEQPTQAVLNQEPSQQPACLAQGGMCLPVPVPVVQPHGGFAGTSSTAGASLGQQPSQAAPHTRSRGEPEQASNGGAPQQEDPCDPPNLGPCMLPSDAQPALVPVAGSVSDRTAAAGVLPVGARQPHPALQLRLQAAAGAIAQRRSSAHEASQLQHSSHFWGSADVQLQPGSEQSQQHISRGHQLGSMGHELARMQSWGTDAGSHQTAAATTQQVTPRACPRVAGTHAHQQLPHSTPHGSTACTVEQATAAPQDAMQGAAAAGCAVTAAPPAQSPADSSRLPGATPDAATTLQQHVCEAVPAGPQQTKQLHESPLLDGSWSAATAHELAGCDSNRGSCSESGGGQVLGGGVLDLPPAWQPGGDEANLDAAHSLTGGTVDAAVAAPQAPQQASSGTRAGGSRGSGLEAAPRPADRQQTPEAPEGAGVGEVSSSAGAVSSGGNSSKRTTTTPTAANTPLAALQRALVEDFVLYEEASAARQHVVGILVAVEQGDAAAGQRLLAPACVELVAATAPAAVPNRLAAYLNSQQVLAAAAAATAAGLPPGDVSAVVAVAAAVEYCQHTRGIGRLLGSASSSRAALEASPQQLRQQRQQQQQLIVKALQQVSSRVPVLGRLLQPLQQSLGTSVTGTPSEAAAALHSAPALQQEDHGPVASTAPHYPRQSMSGPQEELQQQQQQQPVAAGSTQQGHAVGPGPEAGHQELQAAVMELIMQLPELMHGLPGPAVLTYEQFRQRCAQAQQLAAHAMQMLLPAGSSSDGPVADGAAAELAASGLLAASAAAMAASHSLPSEGAGGTPIQHNSHAGHLFANILDSLRGYGAGGSGAQPSSGGPLTGGSCTAGMEARGGAGGFLSRTAAFAAANRLADGLIHTGAATPPASIGLSRAGSLAGAGQLGAWRLPVGVSGSVAGLDGPGGPAAGALGSGMFAPTGTGALLSGGLLAEGGVAGDSILDDMLHSNVRRITCHGLYELCAALAQPAGGQGSPPLAGQQQQQQLQLGDVEWQDPGAAGLIRESQAANEHGPPGRMSGGKAEAVPTVAAAVESNSRSSTHMSLPAGCLAGSKRRLSDTLDEQGRPSKY